MPKQKQESKAAESKKKASGSAAGAPSAIELLKADHRAVEALFEQCRAEKDAGRKKACALRIANALAVHTLLEEEIFYPACRAADVQSDLLDEAQVEHDGAKVLIRQLAECEPDEDTYFDAKVVVLCEYIRHHVSEEEQPGSGIFAKAQASGVAVAELGKRIQARKQELEANLDDEAWGDLQMRALQGVKSGNVSKERGMNSRYSEPERDERGRFMSEDQNYSDRERGDDYRGYRGRGSGEGRNYGGSSSYRNDYEQSRSSRSARGDYDEDRPSGGRGHGGWSGDPQGHSEASERGWEHRSDYEGGRGGSYSRSGGNYYQSQGRGRGDDDYGRSGRGHGGWFGDPEGHSEAAQRGWDDRGGSRAMSRSRNDDDYGRSGRGHGGWFGDSEGHSEAARRGWEDRGGSRSYSRSDDDYNGGRRSGGRGHGGWYGDPEGHSEAARQRNR